MPYTDSDTTLLADHTLVAHPLSYADPNARLLLMPDGGLYRGIYPHRAEFVRRMFADGTVERLVSKRLLIETELTDRATGPFAVLLKHRRLPFVSYPFEWSARMLRDAALLVLDLHGELLRHQLTLQDAHSWNVLWDGARPVFVDFGSIVPYTGGPWAAESEFREFFLYPLQIMAAGRTRVARWLLHDFAVGIKADEAFLLSADGRNRSMRSQAAAAAWRVSKRAVPHAFRPLLRSARAGLAQRYPPKPQPLVRVLDALRDEIASLNFPPAASQWVGYYDHFPPFVPDKSWSAKHYGIATQLADLKPRTVLDVGANKGWFGRAAARLGANVLAIDNDETCVDALYEDLKQDGGTVQPVVMSIANPSPGYGINNGLSASAVERFKCDVVLALAITHHLVFWNNLDFDQIVDALASFTGHALVVEFVPADDEYVSGWMTPRHDWYTRENFLVALRRHFAHIDVRPSHPAPRVLIVARR